MIYVALLRGINVGGNNIISMQQLKTTFENLGLSQVKTYINSGNIIFEETGHTPDQLVTKLEAAIEQDFGFAVKVLLRDFSSLKAITESLPDNWANNQQMKCDVMFLWESVNKASVLDQLTIKAEIDDVRYLSGAIIWRVDRQHITRSGMLKLVGTPLYKQMTIRNCNTVRKLLALMSELQAST